MLSPSDDQNRLQHETIDHTELMWRYLAARQELKDFQFSGMVIGRSGQLSFREYRISYPLCTDTVSIQVRIAASMNLEYSLNLAGLRPQSQSEVGAYEIEIEGFGPLECFLTSGQPIGKEMKIAVGASRDQMDQLFDFACSKERSSNCIIRMFEVEEEAQRIGLNLRDQQDN